MLERLSIKNLALISDAELTFSNKLNVLSGETGAGKSIIVDALMLLMGGKYDKTMLSYNTDSGYVEGVFYITDKSKIDYLTELGIDADEQLIINRKFYVDGRNDIRINGKGVTSKMLKTIMAKFVDICGQNEYQILGDKRTHVEILDSFIGEEIVTSLEKVGAKYAEYVDVKKKITAIGNTAERFQRIDILKYQIEEIERANVHDGEEEELLDFRNKAMHGEKIKLALDNAYDALGGENGAGDKLYDAVKSLSAVSDLSSAYADISERLNASSIEIDDIVSTLQSLLSEVDFNESDLENAENRLSLLRTLRKKYGDLSLLPKKLQSLSNELEILSSSDEAYEELVMQSEKLLKELYELSQAVSMLRRDGAKAFEQAVKDELETLGMKNSQLSVSFADFPSMSDFERLVTSTGADDIEFLLSPNLGQPLLPLIKIISGGEMSRFMLALKVIASHGANVDTMIFDEIDSGISGTVGQEVAKKLANISRCNQVLCVTHLSQIAAMADYQYYIEKDVVDGKTQTHVSLLDESGMIDEISRLSGARDISAGAKQTARELKNWCNDYKRQIR